MRMRSRSMIIAFSQAVTQVVTLGSAIALVRLISKGDVGTYRQAFLVMMFLTGILGLNLPSSVYYFLPTLEEGKRRAFFTQTLLLMGAGALAASDCAIDRSRVNASRRRRVPGAVPRPVRPIGANGRGGS